MIFQSVGNIFYLFNIKKKAIKSILAQIHSKTIWPNKNKSVLDAFIKFISYN